MTYVALAYGFIWGAVFTYVALIGRRVARIDGEIEDLQPAPEARGVGSSWVLTEGTEQPHGCKKNALGDSSRRPPAAENAERTRVRTEPEREGLDSAQTHSPSSHPLSVRPQCPL